MPLKWIEVQEISFNAVLLFERVQLGWLPGAGLPEDVLAIALRGNPAIAWFMEHKAPEIVPWLRRVEQAIDPHEVYFEDEVRVAELDILARLNDWLVYALDPRIYDAQPFLGWDSSELTGQVDFKGKVVVDVGAGTGRLAFTAAEAGAQVVYAVEPVGNMRRYMQEKAKLLGLRQFFVMDGLITAIPLADGSADVVMGGHVFGDEPAKEDAEMRRVVRPGGMVIHCPGNNDSDNGIHEYLVSAGYHWTRFEEPGDGWKRMYWLEIP